MKKKILSGVVAFIGFILSPVSWWNDLFVNFPISYALAIPFGLMNRSFFIPAFIVNYWITNILGLMLMHKGIIGLKNNECQRFDRKQLLSTIFFCMLYTCLIVILIFSGILKFPTEYLDYIHM